MVGLKNCINVLLVPLNSHQAFEKKCFWKNHKS